MAHRDDLIVNDNYSLQATHSEEEGKIARKEIYKVTLFLSLITILEVFLGVYIKQGSAFWNQVKWVFIVLTIIKAGYIVMVFMHLGSERKSLRQAILYPYYLCIIYLLTILIFEGMHQLDKVNLIIF
jgi:cytochrome c oxidase subunit IV